MHMTSSFHPGGSMPKITNRQAELRGLLEQLNLGGMAEICAEVALRAAKEHLTHEAYLWELASHERDLRTQRRTARLLRASGLPAEKTFRTFDLGRSPATIQSQAGRLKTGTSRKAATNGVASGGPGVGKGPAWPPLAMERTPLAQPVLRLPPRTL